jgi:RNA polymerase sigma-70 factor (ECF subfamily)
VQQSVDQKAELFSIHRPLLLSIAYRMLGSMAEAEDMVQDAYIRWQQTTTRVRTPRAFLVTTVSRLCINHLKSARVRREEYVGAWLPEPVSDEALSAVPPAGDESLSIAFLLLLERLTPVERAVFLLREVFEYEYEEIAGILKQSEVACRQVLRRARQHIAENRPRFAPSREQRADLLRRFLDASSRGDLDGLVALLHKDVVLYADSGGKATAIPRPICGPEHVARFILRAPRKLLPSGLVRQFGEVNGQPAIVSYCDGRPHSVFTIEISADAIRNIFIMANPDKLNSVRSADPLSQTLASCCLESEEQQP